MTRRRKRRKIKTHPFPGVICANKTRGRRRRAALRCAAKSIIDRISGASGAHPVFQLRTLCLPANDMGRPRIYKGGDARMYSQRAVAVPLANIRLALAVRNQGDIRCSQRNRAVVGIPGVAISSFPIIRSRSSRSLFLSWRAGVVPRDPRTNFSSLSLSIFLFLPLPVSLSHSLSQISAPFSRPCKEIDRPQFAPGSRGNFCSVLVFFTPRLHHSDLLPSS